MKIVEMSLEGFKSYGERVKIGPFSPNFTAICGPNGTGKSNFFDAICFGMGFRVGNDMRVDNLTDLIYQRGQSNISSAAVTIVFDNQDKKFSPTMYADCDKITISRQIALRGRDRFFVNGQLRKPTDITRMLLEAKLNVHNAHFVVLQGTIQKVILMKPKEILSMFQESVGTNVFDKEKERSQKVLTEKQVQLQKIEKDINESLEPALEKSKKEKANYIRWMNLGSEIIAMKYYVALNKKRVLHALLCKKKKIVEEIQLDLSNNDQQQITKRNELSAIRDRLKILSQQIAELETTPHAQKLKQDINNTQLEQNKLTTLITSISKDISNGLKELKLQQKSLQSTESRLKAFEKDNKSYIEEESALKAKTSKTREIMNKANERLELAKLGKWTTESGEPLGEIVDDLKQKETDLNNRIIALNPIIKHLESEVQRLGKTAKNTREIEEAERSLKKWQDMLSATELKLQDFDYDANEENSIQTKIFQLNSDEDRYQDELRSLAQRFAREERIRQKFPDVNKVPGPLLDVFSIHKGYEQYSLALEEAAKTRLYHIVVDNDATATELFQWATNHGVRVTCLPINRLNNKRPSRDVILRATKLANHEGGNLFYALDILEYDVSHESCLCSAFNVFLTDNQKIARLINGQDNWIYNTITIDGDCYNPTGQISGGSKSGMNHLIKNRTRFNHVRKTIENDIKLERDKLKALLASCINKQARSQELKSTIQSCQQKIETINVQISIKKDTTDEGKLFKAQQELHEKSNAKQSLENECRSITKDLQPHEKYLNNCLKNPQKEMDNLSKSYNDNKSEYDILWKKYQELLDRMSQEKFIHSNLVTEKDAIVSELDKIQCQIKESEKEYEDLQVQLPVIESNLNNLQHQYDAISQQKYTAQKQYKELDEQSRSIQQDLEDNQAKNSRLHNELNKLKNDIISLTTNLDAAKKDLLNQPQHVMEMPEYLVLLQKYDRTENGGVEICSISLEELTELYNAMIRERSSLQMKIDKRAIDMLSHIEAEFNELKNNQSKVQSERNSVQQLIENIEAQKTKKLNTSYTLVDNVFNHILCTMLPGNVRGFLSLVEPNDINEGIEINIEFNGMKKSGLHDLSGGQKSLLALSFILALLKLNPCPLYILDEVDAALDIGHTQNLGSVIKKYFTESQFLIVSHRENFFKNASIVFRTSCVNGMSHIQRL
ncbi:putative structural maintenance of chromosomes protein [Gregarina niphandrodes]|uniref:Structural maintenance of chromosomes protein n=1 Tax=Gregarina niphandrodes TaxID=110365 RepID=A0A023AZ49_GRENI|nr:putative structural maintenance of chromosomes protein [Gregarina niphandrodes]EZG43924.1 putative structural maintenance of chromosomes protein [Gregarina niphandrodes]|eukprot:XP_011132895.1 putative structural maintenance of chromosomes protein [Gregarina niphandrodes]